MTKKDSKGLELNNRIKTLRREKGLSQAALAEMIDVRRETIIHLERNKYNPSLKLASQIARIFDLPIEEVLWYEIN